MLKAAQLVRTFLDELGLQSFLKTSGGEGLHVVVPLTSRDNCRIEFPLVHMWQAPSACPHIADFLVRQGIDSISLNPDSLLAFLKRVNRNP
jgi:hypothetical protein